MLANIIYAIVSLGGLVLFFIGAYPSLTRETVEYKRGQEIRTKSVDENAIRKMTYKNFVFMFAGCAVTLLATIIYNVLAKPKLLLSITYILGSLVVFVYPVYLLLYRNNLQKEYENQHTTVRRFDRPKTSQQSSNTSRPAPATRPQPAPTPKPEPAPVTVQEQAPTPTYVAPPVVTVADDKFITAAAKYGVTQGTIEEKEQMLLDMPVIQTMLKERGLPLTREGVRQFMDEVAGE